MHHDFQEDLVHPKSGHSNHHRAAAENEAIGSATEDYDSSDFAGTYFDPRPLVDDDAKS